MGWRDGCGGVGVGAGGGGLNFKVNRSSVSSGWLLAGLALRL